MRTIKNEEIKKGKDLIPDAGEAAHFIAHQEGKLFLKVTKSRLISTNSTAIVRINGKTGRVEANGNLPEAPSVEPERLEFKEEASPLQTVGSGLPEIVIEEPQRDEFLPFGEMLSDEDLPF